MPEWRFHQWTEFGNRLLTGVVAAAVAAAVLTAYRRRPRRADLVWWAWGLVAGVVGQIVLGGITVRIRLHPLLVGAHFLLSLVLLWNAVVLWVRAAGGPGRGRPAVAPSVVWHGRAMLVLASAMVFTGTLVTGTGPNSGDDRARRLSFQLTEIARVHSATVWCFTIVTLVLALRLSRQSTDMPQRAWRLARWLLAAVVAQGAVGYIQYALGVPPSIVEIHVVGAVVVWSLTMLLYLQLFDRGPADVERPGKQLGRSRE